MNEGRSTLPSIGVDLVEYARARRLWRSGRQRLRRVLSARQYQKVSRSAHPEKALAEILAAQEAVFKASGGWWMGPEGFGKYSVPKGRITFRRTRRYVVATCAGI